MKLTISFKNITINKLINKLFWVGLIPILIHLYLFTDKLFASNNADSTSEAVNRVSTSGISSVSVTVPLGPSPGTLLLISLIYLAASIVLWKLACEIIYIIVNYFASNTKASNS